MSNLETLNDAMLDGLKDLYSAETQLIKILPLVHKKASCKKLQALISAHIKETEGQIVRLKEIEAIVDVKLMGKTCFAMQGLGEECKEVLANESDNSALIDVMLAGIATRIEHYEIAAYESVVAIARETDNDDVAELLAETLAEEMAANDVLVSHSRGELLPKANLEDESVNVGKAKVMRSGDRAARTHASKLVAVVGLSLLFVTAGSDAMATPETVLDAREIQAARYDADNSGRNLRDQSGDRETADSQAVSSEDIKLLSEIRRKIVANSSISTYGKNIKIIVANQTVTLRGPVQSVAERTWIEKSAMELATDYEVINQLEVASE